MSTLELTIRCPHQPNEDMNVVAKSDWTVRQLKINLSNFHPSKPAPERQRIVFAGQLLRDEAKLSEYFRRYNANVDASPGAVSSDPYVLHLVYTSGVEKNIATAEERTKNETELRHRRPVASTNFVPPPTQPNASATGSGSPYVAPYWSWPSGQQQQAAADSTVTNDWVQQQQQLYMAMNTMMTQWYGQYMQAMYDGSGGLYPFTGIQPANNIASDAVVQQQPQQPLQQQQDLNRAPVARQPAMNAQGGLAPADVDDDDPRNRDWLDYIYMACRAGLLLMILYFYSSVERFVFVLLCCTFMYGLQAGWFGRRVAQQQAQNGARAVPGEAVGAAAPQAANEAGQNPPGDPPTEDVPQERPIQPNPLQHDIPLTAWNVFWSTCWTFISSFFASLVPERPPPLNL